MPVFTMDFKFWKNTCSSSLYLPPLPALIINDIPLFLMPFLGILSFGCIPELFSVLFKSRLAHAVQVESGHCTVSNCISNLPTTLHQSGWNHLTSPWEANASLHSALRGCHWGLLPTLLTKTWAWDPARPPRLSQSPKSQAEKTGMKFTGADFPPARPPAYNCPLCPLRPQRHPGSPF